MRMNATFHEKKMTFMQVFLYHENLSLNLSKRMNIICFIYHLNLFYTFYINFMDFLYNNVYTVFQQVTEHFSLFN